MIIFFFSIFKLNRFHFSSHNIRWDTLIVLDLVSQVHDVVLMNVYLDLGNSGGSGFWNEEYMSQVREIGSLVYEQPETKVDESCHS
jgi:hypothetical protein